MLIPKFLDRSGNPGSVRTCPFLLPIDLNKKNQIQGLVIKKSQNDDKSGRRKVCTRSWVSLLPEKAFLTCLKTKNIARLSAILSKSADACLRQLKKNVNIHLEKFDRNRSKVSINSKVEVPLLKNLIATTSNLKKNVAVAVKCYQNEIEGKPTSCKVRSNQYKYKSNSKSKSSSLLIHLALNALNTASAEQLPSFLILPATKPSIENLVRNRSKSFVFPPPVKSNITIDKKAPSE